MVAPPNACLGLMPVVVSSKSLLTLRCGVPCDSHALSPFSVIISFMILYARMNDLAIRVGVRVSVLVMVTVMVRVRVFVCITLRPPQRLCRSRRFQPPSSQSSSSLTPTISCSLSCLPCRSCASLASVLSLMSLVVRSTIC